MVKNNLKKKDNSTEDAILQVARKVFTQKGLSGARMQDIADEAGVNKALLHYYFQSKEKLFALIFDQEFEKFFSSLAVIISSDLGLFEKIKQWRPVYAVITIPVRAAGIFVIGEIIVESSE